jgi:hypothetical protein
MDAAKSCIQLAERRKETTFQICSLATKFLNLGKQETTLSFARSYVQLPEGISTFTI